MRPRSVLLSLWLCVVPALAHAQAFVVSGSAGPTLNDRGTSAAASVGWSPWSRVVVAVGVERTHLASRVDDDGRGSRSAFRGGTVTLGSGEVRMALLPRNRLSPYVLGGLAAGVSRPTVNAMFPAPVENGVRAVFGGAGLHVPLGARFALFAEYRLLLVDEANELLALAPLRLGLSWRF